MNLENLGLSSIWVPAKIHSPREMLMVVLHGRGDSAEGFTWMPDALNLPFMNYLMVTAPTPYYDGFSWYGMAPDQLPGILASRDLLEKVFQEIFKAGYSADQCFLFGFSQGCLMTIEFGSRFPHLLAGYIGISGYVFGPEAVVKEADPKVKKGNWLITHGVLDDVLEVEKTRPQIQYLKDNGFSIDYREYRKAHTLDEREELPALKAWIQNKSGAPFSSNEVS